MTPLAKKLLIGSLVLLGAGLLFLLGILPAGGKTPGLFVLFPIGAVLFGLFLIIRMLGGEAKNYDQEHARCLARADRHTPDNSAAH